MRSILAFLGIESLAVAPALGVDEPCARVDFLSGASPLCVFGKRVSYDVQLHCSACDEHAQVLPNKLQAHIYSASVQLHILLLFCTALPTSCPALPPGGYWPPQAACQRRASCPPLQASRPPGCSDPCSWITSNARACSPCALSLDGSWCPSPVFAEMFWKCFLFFKMMLV